MLALAKSGATIWWRREGFHQVPFRGTEPKWHVLTGRITHLNDPTMGPNDDPVWTALCDYRKSFDELISLKFPNLRKTAPRTDTRCRKCVVELPEYLKQLTANQTEGTPVEEAQSTDRPAKENTPS